MKKIDAARAFIRARYGVYRECDVYRRGDHMYIPYGKGFLRITNLWDGHWGTSHPHIKVLELTGVE